MNCRRAISMLSAYTDGELSGQEMLVLSKHLESCAGCSQELIQIREVKNSYADLSPVAPADYLLDNIFVGLDKAPEQVGSIGYFFDMHKNRVSKSALATAAVCAVLLTVFVQKLPIAGLAGNQNSAALMANGVAMTYNGDSAVHEEHYRVQYGESIPVMVNKTTYAYCRSRCANKMNKSAILTSKDNKEPNFGYDLPGTAVYNE